MEENKNMDQEAENTGAKAEESTSKSFTEQVNEVIDKVAEKAKPAVKKATKKVKEKAEPTVKAVKEKAKPKVKAVKEKAKEVKTKVDSKLYEHEVIVQYQGNSFYAKDANEKSIEDFVANGGKRDQIKQVQLYIKPEERACYYVINNVTTGRVDL